MLFTKFLLGMAFAAMLTTGAINAKTQKKEKVAEDVVVPEVTARRQTRNLGPQRMVSADLRWTDEQGIAHPLVGAKVNLHDPDVFSPNYYTDSTGHVEIIYDYYDYDQDLYLKVSAQNDTANIKVQTKQGVLYTYDFQVNIMIDDYIDYTFTTAVEGDFDRALNIYQAAYYYGMYAKQINYGTAMPMCSINWPGSTDEGCYYSYNSITISGKTAASGYPSSWASWDVIGHEYGHHVQRTKGITQNPGGTHYINTNNIDSQYSNGYTLETAKSRGHKLSWAEGWPTFWSTVAQSTFPADIRNISTVGDTRYTTYQGFWYELDTYGALTNGYARGSYGDADEIAIQSILYKLYSPTIDTYDKFAISAQTLFDIVCNDHSYTFTQFIQAMYNLGYDQNNIAKLLGQYRVIPTQINIENNYINFPATFSWSTYMGSSNLRFNSFDFVVLDSNLNQVFRVDNISCSVNTATYTPTESQWNQILALGTNYYVYVISKQTLSYVSGLYASERFEFAQPTEYLTGFDTVMTPSAWGFRQQYYFDGQSAVHTPDEHLTINSTRLRCGYIEQSYVVLSAKHNEAGHAYLSLEFNKPVYFYSFDIALWSDSEGINRNNAELVMQVKDEYGDWREEADFLNDYTLPTKDQGFLNYGVWDDDGIYGIRWLETAPATGTKNKGRIAFNNMLFHTALED